MGAELNVVARCDRVGGVHIRPHSCLLTGALGTFAYLGRWLAPKVLTPTRFVDGFEEVNGVRSGFRRNHAKREAFLARHPETAEALKFIKSQPASSGRRRPDPGRRPLRGSPAESASAIPTHDVAPGAPGRRRRRNTRCTA